MKLVNILEKIYKENWVNEYDSIVESPMRIEKWNSSQLGTNVENYKFTKSIKNRVKPLNDKFNNFDIYSYQIDNRNYDLFVDGDLTYAFFSYKLKEKTMIEEKVWQDETAWGLCRKVILDYYLKKYEEIISDAMHTEFGERYWKKLLNDAKKTGHNIFLYIDGEYHELNLHNLDQYFSSNPKFMDVRFSIKK